MVLLAAYVAVVLCLLVRFVLFSWFVESFLHVCLFGVGGVFSELIFCRPNFQCNFSNFKIAIRVR